MSDVKNFVSITDRSTKAIATATGNLSKVITELNVLASSSSEIAEEIQHRQNELSQINTDFDLRFAEAQADLKVKVLGNEEKVLEGLLKSRGLVTIAPAELTQVRDALTTAEAATESAVHTAVENVRAELNRDLHSRLGQLQSEHKVAVAELTANSKAKDDRIAMLTEQLEAARGDLKAERETRLAIAQAESNRQGVTVNTGK